MLFQPRLTTGGRDIGTGPASDADLVPLNVSKTCSGVKTFNNLSVPTSLTLNYATSTGVTQNAYSYAYFSCGTSYTLPTTGTNSILFENRTLKNMTYDSSTGIFTFGATGFYMVNFNLDLLLVPASTTSVSGFISKNGPSMYLTPGYINNAITAGGTRQNPNMRASSMEWYYTGETLRFRFNSTAGFTCLYPIFGSIVMINLKP